MSIEQNRHLRLVTIDIGNFVIQRTEDVKDIMAELELAQAEYPPNVIPLFRPRKPNPDLPDLAA